MNLYRADIHIHTSCSPSADLEMSPANIVERSLEKGIHIIGITDHNSTAQVEVISNIAEKAGIYVLPGAEITTSENVHCLVYMPDLKGLKYLQELIDENTVFIKNNPKVYGYQIIVDEEDNLIEEISHLLIVPLKVSLTALCNWVHSHNGIIIPAHIDRPVNGLLMHYGKIPDNLNFDALELSPYTQADILIKEEPRISEYTLIRSSDSHVINTIGNNSSIFSMKELSFSEIKMALQKEGERKVIEKSDIHASTFKI